MPGILSTPVVRSGRVTVAESWWRSRIASHSVRALSGETPQRTTVIMLELASATVSAAKVWACAE